MTTRYTQVLLYADECQTSDISKQGKWGGAGETKNPTRRAQIFQFWMLGATYELDRRFCGVLNIYCHNLKSTVYKSADGKDF